jgi:hypothetical protein
MVEKVVEKKEAKMPIVVEVNSFVNWDGFDESDYKGVPDAIGDWAHKGATVYGSGSPLQSIAKNSPKISHNPVLSQPSLPKHPPCPLPPQQVINPPSVSPMTLTTKMKIRMIKKIYEVQAQQKACSQMTSLS